ncbi:MAG: hypothetical protein Q9212_007087, partial [Teloschistes hypoglaucus]
MDRLNPRLGVRASCGGFSKDMIAESDGESAKSKRQEKSAKVVSIAAGTKTEGKRLRERRRKTLGLEVDSAKCDPHGSRWDPHGQDAALLSAKGGSAKSECEDVCLKAGNGRDLVARGASASITHVQRAVPRLKSLLSIIRVKSQSLLARPTPFPSEQTATSCGDRMWVKKYYYYHERFDLSRYDEIQELYEELRGEIRLRASGYVAMGNLQDALYIYEALHRMETTYCRPLQFSFGYGMVIEGTLPSNPSELADLHLRHGNFFQAEFLLEESLILQDQVIKEKLGWAEVDMELPLSSLIDLYQQFKARLLAWNPDCLADRTIMCRVARVDNLQLWKGLSLAGLIPPFNHADLSIAKNFKAPNLVQLILDRENCIPGVASHFESALPLHKAVLCNSYSELSRSLDEGKVHIESRDKYNHTPLMLAVCLGREEM